MRIYRTLTTKDKIQEGDQFENGNEWTNIYKTNTSSDWMIGQFFDPSRDPKIRRKLTDTEITMGENGEVIVISHTAFNPTNPPPATPQD